MYLDFKELLAAFNEHKVKYLIIGGYAVGFHAEPRATKDMDILIGTEPKNAEAVHAALKTFGAPLRGVAAMDFIQKKSFFRIGKPPIMIDLFSEVKGVLFETVWARRKLVTIDVKTKLKAWIIGYEDLIISKIAAGRPQDLADVAALRATAALGMKRGKKRPNLKVRGPKKSRSHKKGKK